MNENDQIRRAIVNEVCKEFDLKDPKEIRSGKKSTSLPRRVASYLMRQHFEQTGNDTSKTLGIVSPSNVWTGVNMVRGIVEKNKEGDRELIEKINRIQATVLASTDLHPTPVLTTALI
ncbi:MAG: hypothetical protein A3B11_02000 [Candidatus Taylorbacteria bacterium RIFCSPLOWO2_01_FULL_44_26]|uniref:Chromosomal replication initiator DnaA C-terminal domain-containing protein n=1 Tax=Candidatus Taylorbacteria bacterium RIFCSPLOWO2_01_FULL_44_26 TaxID=1802318 RepID=A0A1G2N627_9BACT|nr:MAG: hypothetical protein A3B11_02000 [Candidatus Taylorbacteria bacterium RIFCSPLOWO2_01_FULL_44_26]